MGWLTGISKFFGSVWSHLFGLGGAVAEALQNLWHLAATIFKFAVYLATHPMLAIAKIMALIFGIADGIDRDIVAVLRRIRWWIWVHFIKPTRIWTLKHIRALRRWTAYRFVQAYKLMFALYRAARKYALHLVKMEAHRRRQGDINERHLMIKRVTALHQAIEKEAASGYNAGLQGRMSLIARLLEYAGARNPVIRGLVTKVIAGLLEILGVESWAGRTILTFLLRDIVTKLGLDKPIGALADDLLAPIIGTPRPKDLNGVVRDLSDRISKLENMWATFMQDGGPEILQAGEEWKGITGLVADAALLAFTAQLVTAPQAWASEVDAVLGAPVNAAMQGIADLVRKA